MLDLPLAACQGRLRIARAADALIEGLDIRTGNHCFGCTAGCGSSCTGALTSFTREGAPAEAIDLDEISRWAARRRGDRDRDLYGGSCRRCREDLAW